MNALIYLPIQTPVMTGEDLERLHTLYLHAKACDYTVTEVWPVVDLEDKGNTHNSWYNAQQDLTEGRFDVILLWDHSIDDIDSLHREVLLPAPEKTPAEGFQPGARVKYDDSPGEVLERRYNGGRDSWDCQVKFDDGDSGWCWESDLTPE
jgi:hypothetical protein